MEEIWKCHKDAEVFLEEGLKKSLNPWLQKFSERLEQETSTRLFDWLSHITLKEAPPGFEKEAEGVFYHPGAHLPRVVIGEKPHLGIMAEDIASFLKIHNLHASTEGTPYSPYREAKLDGFSIVERRGTRSLQPISEPKEKGDLYLKWKEKLSTRDRTEDFNPKQIIKDLGQGRAASLFLEVEREFWQSKNQAGQIQKKRQDALGLGWANHDHHTFRSTRVGFKKLVNLFEELGFYCRERYYAGKEAGWGAQIMEQRDAFVVVFLDVDLSPDEIAIDFAHAELPDRKELGTIGLWCALHGDSIHEAGMHHLEAQFLFENLSKDLVKDGVEMMAPFSHFNYLKQAFTKGEHWKVAPERIENLLKKGQISEEQAKKFAKEGALGSHLENLERREGYKGFNQKNVSLIIKKTDPRS